jgi:hypothetical protein
MIWSPAIYFEFGYPYKLLVGDGLSTCKILLCRLIYCSKHIRRFTSNLRIAFEEHTPLEKELTELEGWLRKTSEPGPGGISVIADLSPPSTSGATRDISTLFA